MDKGKCILTYPVEGYRETSLKYAMKLGAKKVILLDENESYRDLFNNFKLITDVKPIAIDDLGLVINSVANIISTARSDHDDITVILPPSDTITNVGIYLAACMEKIKVLAPGSDYEMDCLTMPLFPFVSLNENEKFALAKIMENTQISARNLLMRMKKEGYYQQLKEISALRHLQRTLNRLEELELISKEQRSKYFVWSPTGFGKLVLNQGNGKKG